MIGARKFFLDNQVNLLCTAAPMRRVVTSWNLVPLIGQSLRRWRFLEFLKMACQYNNDAVARQVGDEGQILKTEVIVSVHVEEILKVDELDSVFSCKIDLLLTWRDQVQCYLLDIWLIIFTSVCSEVDL